MAMLTQAMCSPCPTLRAFTSSACAHKQRGLRRASTTFCKAESCDSNALPRRTVLNTAVAVVAAVVTSGYTSPAIAAKDMGAATTTEDERVLCDKDCAANIGERTTTKSGLEYVVIVPGKGPSPPVGIQAAVHYVAMTPEGRIFDNSLMKGAPYYIRIGSGAVVAGLDEALLDMSTGEIRRIYVPGNLAFPKGLASAPGRPKVPPKSPVVFDVKLIYIPGLSDDLEVEGADS